MTSESGKRCGQGIHDLVMTLERSKDSCVLGGGVSSMSVFPPGRPSTDGPSAHLSHFHFPQATHHTTFTQLVSELDFSEGQSGAGLGSVTCCQRTLDCENVGIVDSEPLFARVSRKIILIAIVLHLVR